jgi:hypothetical protein
MNEDMKAFLKRHQITIFFVLVIVLSWFPWYSGFAPETVTFMPSLLGLAMALAVGGKQGVLNLFRSVGRWRVQPGYWLKAWFGPLFIFVVGLGIYLISCWWCFYPLTDQWAKNWVGVAMFYQNYNSVEGQ